MQAGDPRFDRPPLGSVQRHIPVQNTHIMHGESDTEPSGELWAAPAEPALPRRALRDPKELRAMAHPVRLAILLRLAEGGPATATELAGQLQDQSPANCSWHLRQLARYGFITEAEHGPGRQRRWRIVAESTYISADESPEMVAASDAFDEVLVDGQLATLRKWLSTRRQEPQQWRDASLMSHSVAWLTSGEMAEFRKAYSELVEQRLFPLIAERAHDPANAPTGSRPVRLMTMLFPSGPAMSEVSAEDASLTPAKPEEIDER